MELTNAKIINVKIDNSIKYKCTCFNRDYSNEIDED